MRLEKLDQRGEEPRFAGPTPELVRPDSGQVEEALRPLRLVERCGKRRKCKGIGIGWSLAVHGLGRIRAWEDRIGEDPDR